MSKLVSSNSHNHKKTNDLLQILKDFAAESCPGRQYPSQNFLVNKYNVSRSTVEKIFRILADEGLMEKKQGSGCFVPGEKTIHFLMPGQNILTRMDSDGFTVRERLEGCMTCARERRMGINMLYLSPNDNVLEMDCKSIASLNNSSMIILQDWFFKTFPEIEKKSLRTALISSGNIGYGSAQYLRQWQQLLIDRPQGITDAMDILYRSGCRKIAIAGHYISYCRGLEMAAYRKFALEHDMPCLAIELSSLENSYSKSWHDQISRLYAESKFDGLLLFFREYLAVSNSINEYLQIPENIKLIAWNFFNELAPGIAPIPCFNPPNRQIGYDAVTQLLDNPRRGGRKIYPVEFKNLTEEMSYYLKEKKNEIH